MKASELQASKDRADWQVYRQVYEQVDEQVIWQVDKQVYWQVRSQISGNLWHS